MSYRLTDPNPVWVGLLGTDSAADGTLQFYDQGTTTPKVTYSDEELTTPNANPVELNSVGRSDTEIWLDGPYTVVLKDEEGTTVWTRDVVPEVSPTTALPDPTTLPGGTVKSNGVGYELVDEPGLPDPTDSAGYQVVVNSTSTGFNLQPIAAPERPDITITPTSATIGETGNDSHRFELTGTGSAPASGTNTTQAAVTFAPEVFTSTPIVIPIPNVAAVGTGGFLVAVSVIAKSPTGFTVKFDTNDQGGAGSNIINDVTFDWIAIGRKTVT